MANNLVQIVFSQNKWQKKSNRERVKPIPVKKPVIFRQPPKEEGKTYKVLTYRVGVEGPTLREYGAKIGANAFERGESYEVFDIKYIPIRFYKI
jgi:hypothetical protein